MHSPIQQKYTFFSKKYSMETTLSSGDHWEIKMIHSEKIICKFDD